MQQISVNEFFFDDASQEAIVVTSVIDRVTIRYPDGVRDGLLLAKVGDKFFWVFDGSPVIPATSPRFTENEARIDLEHLYGTWIV